MSSLYVCFWCSKEWQISNWFQKISCMHMQHDINYTLCTSFLWIDVISQARQKNQQNTNNKQTNQSTYLKCPKLWLSIPSKITNWTFNQKMETRTWGGIAFIVRDYMCIVIVREHFNSNDTYIFNCLFCSYEK